MTRKLIALLFLACLFLAPSLCGEEFSYRIQKVPYAQYLDADTLAVVPSFDGSYSLDRWEDILTFARENQVKFTFFISGVYFIPHAEKDLYLYPVDPLKKGLSDIGFGGASTDVVKRIEYVNRALKEGHDIETHLNGHFDGSAWPESAWDVEFGEFNRICSFLKSPVHHVRFPLLAFNHRVFPVLAKYGIQSITSVVESDYDNFNRISGEYEGKPYTFLEFPIAYEHENKANIILMDYNFYVYDELHHIKMESAEQEMIKLYLDEAERCFAQHRPFFLSHHFSNWYHAAYWNAMKTVILEVKRKYKVKFMTISELCDTLKQ